MHQPIPVVDPAATRQSAGSVDSHVRRSRNAWNSWAMTMSWATSAAARNSGSRELAVSQSRASITARQRRSRPVPPGASSMYPNFASCRRCHEQFAGLSPTRSANSVAVAVSVAGSLTTSSSSRRRRSGCASARSSCALVTLRGSSTRCCAGGVGPPVAGSVPMSSVMLEAYLSKAPLRKTPLRKNSF